MYKNLINKLNHIYAATMVAALLCCGFIIVSSFMPGKNQFTAAEQQQISIAINDFYLLRSQLPERGLAKFHADSGQFHVLHKVQEQLHL